MTQITDADIALATRISNLKDFSGSYEPLGGGEVNDTFLLECGNTRAVLRISRFRETRMLHQEARALKLLKIERVPKLIYFNEDKPINGRLWIMESYVKGVAVEHMSDAHYKSLGALLASVHAVKKDVETVNDIWQDLLYMCKNFGDSAALLHHPDPKLKVLINEGREHAESLKRTYSNIQKSLVHGDVTTNNLLIDRDDVGLIDWEFATFRDPMQDFSTIYYEDMELNRSKWRIKISDNQKEALFRGYEDAGGNIDEDRIRTWIIIDKLGAAIYLYWKMNQSGHAITAEQTQQYETDLQNLIHSLERIL